MNNKLYIDYNEWNTSGEICEDQEDEQFPEYETSYIHFFIKNLFRNKKCVINQSFEFPVNNDVFYADNVYVVVVRHCDGDTFGATEGCWQIVTITENEEKANEIKRFIETYLHDSDSYFKDNEKEKLKEMINNKNFHCNWGGCFSSLQYVEIINMKIS